MSDWDANEEKRFKGIRSSFAKGIGRELRSSCGSGKRDRAAGGGPGRAPSHAGQGGQTGGAVEREGSGKAGNHLL